MDKVFNSSKILSKELIRRWLGTVDEYELPGLNCISGAGRCC
jgi:hypothetical protein